MSVTKVYQVVFWDGMSDVTKGFYSTLERAQEAQKTCIYSELITGKQVVAEATIMEHWVEVVTADETIYLCIGHTENSRGSMSSLVTTDPAQVQNFVSYYRNRCGYYHCLPTVSTFVLD